MSDSVIGHDSGCLSPLSNVFMVVEFYHCLFNTAVISVHITLTSIWIM